MKAIIVRDAGGVDQLVMGEVSTPEPTPEELLVRVKATALNRADILQREGKYPPPPGASPLLGLEMAGVVERVGSEGDGWKKGDRVFGLLPGGGYGEYCVIPKKMAMPIPKNLSFEEAAAVPEVFLTAYQALFWLGSLQKREWVLIHAGASGVGTAAIQLVREVGAEPLVTAGTVEKLSACREMGAAAAFSYREGSFAPRVKEATGGRGVDLILDFVGAPYWEQNIQCLATDGRLILISTLGGPKVEKVNLLTLISKRIQVTGTTLRARSLDYKIRLTEDFGRFALPRFRDGRLKPVIDKVFSWEAVREAHRRMEENQNIGKIVLKVD